MVLAGIVTAILTAPVIQLYISPSLPYLEVSEEHLKINT